MSQQVSSSTSRFKYLDHSMERFVHWARMMKTWSLMHHKVKEKKPAFMDDERKMDLDKSWAEKLRKARPGAFDTTAELMGMLTPAIDMASALDKVSTPAQKVRLWSEAIIEAITLISPQLCGRDPLGGPDIPSIVLFLTCLSECPEMTYHVKLARLFCLDNYGAEGDKFKLYSWTKKEDLSEQYTFQADQRAIDHSHYLLWAEDTLTIIAEDSGELEEVAHVLNETRSQMEASQAQGEFGAALLEADSVRDRSDLIRVREHVEGHDEMAEPLARDLARISQEIAEVPLDSTAGIPSTGANLEPDSAGRTSQHLKTLRAAVLAARSLSSFAEFGERARRRREEQPEERRTNSA